MSFLQLNVLNDHDNYFHHCSRAGADQSFSSRMLLFFFSYLFYSINSLYLYLIRIVYRDNDNKRPPHTSNDKLEATQTSRSGATGSMLGPPNPSET
jgi:hypothetical protein